MRDHRRTATAIRALFDTGIFDRNGDPLFYAAVTRLMIELNDLLQAMAKDGRRLSHPARVQLVRPVRDVTALVNQLRNAMCHVASSEHRVRRQGRPDGWARLMSVRPGASIAVNGHRYPEPPDGDLLIIVGDYAALMLGDLATAAELAFEWVEVRCDDRGQVGSAQRSS